MSRRLAPRKLRHVTKYSIEPNVTSTIKIHASTSERRQIDRLLIIDDDTRWLLVTEHVSLPPPDIARDYRAVASVFPARARIRCPFELARRNDGDAAVRERERLGAGRNGN